MAGVIAAFVFQPYTWVSTRAAKLTVTRFPFSSLLHQHLQEIGSLCYHDTTAALQIHMLAEHSPVSIPTNSIGSCRLNENNRGRSSSHWLLRGALLYTHQCLIRREVPKRMFCRRAQIAKLVSWTSKKGMT